MKKTVLKTAILAGMVLSVASCQNDNILYEYSKEFIHPDAYIEFGNYVNNMTRSSKAVGYKDFSLGDTMAIWGTQETDGEIDLIFRNKDVRYLSDSIWTYDNKKIWNQESSYLFYGVYPYSSTPVYSMNLSNFYVTIANYTTPNAPADQTDLMVSERRSIKPFDPVDMVFHHLLSNVNVFVKLGDFDTTNIQSVTIKNLKLNNIMSTGTYAQTGWDEDNPVGAWSDLKNYMDIAPVTEVLLTKKEQPIYADYLMIPQKLFSTQASPKDVSVDVKYKILYTDGTPSTFTKKGVRLTGLTGTSDGGSKPISEWEPGYKYNYILTFNPEKSTRIWYADGDGSLKIDPATGDTIKDDDTPFPGSMRYNPDQPDIIYVFEDSNNDTIPDTWKPYPIVWEDIDGDDKLEAGIDRDGDGHIDNVDGDNKTQQKPGGDPDKDPTDGNPNNPGGKDVILVHVDTNHDGKVDDNDGWVQLQKDPSTGIIEPERETEDSENATIEFSARVTEWAKTYSVGYNVQN